MKIATLYSGQLRTWNRVRDNQLQNIGENDMFFYTEEKPEGDFFQFVQCPGDYYNSTFPDCYASNKNPITRTHNSLQQWHNSFLGFCLVPKDYDVIIRSRCDIELSGKIDFSKYTYEDNTVYIPSGNDHCGGVNDQFAFGSYEAMKKYFSVYLNHGKLFAAGLCFHTEFYTTENLKMLGVNIVRIPQTNVIIRHDMDNVYSESSRMITSESPDQHWRMLDPKGKIVMDFGCGRNFDHFTTPEYFLNRGARKVYGVEMSHSEKPWYEENVKDSNLRVFTEEITTKEQLHYYLMLLSPQVIKMDIEGHESLLGEIDTIDLESVDEIAVEYHSQKLRHLIEHNFQRLGFTKIEFYILIGFDPQEQGVIHLTK